MDTPLDLFLSPPGGCIMVMLTRLAGVSGKCLFLGDDTTNEVIGVLLLSWVLRASFLW